MDPDLDPGGPKTYGSDGSASLSSSVGIFLFALCNVHVYSKQIFLNLLILYIPQTY